jgi:hypothetical protein
VLEAAGALLKSVVTGRVPPRTDEEITVTREALFVRRLPRIRQGVRRNPYVAGHHGPTATKGTVMKRLIVGLSTTVLVWGRSGGRRYRTGSTQCSCAARFLARLSGGQPIRPMSLVPRGSPGADRQSSYEPSGLGFECLPHLLVRLFRAGQCRPEYFRGLNFCPIPPWCP